MKNRTLFLSLLIVLIAALISWRFGKSNAPKPPITANATTAPSAVIPRSSLAGASSSVPANNVDALLRSPAGQTRIQQFQNTLDADNARPINVYGKVIDQYGQSVAGAEVKGGTLLNVGFERSGGEKFSTVTDGQGQFSFTGLHGARFGFGVEKPGYEYNPKLYLSWWDSYKPNPHNPAIFIIWKLQGAESMAHTQFDSRVPYDGRSATFDLSSGKSGGAGNLRVTLTRNPLQVKRGIDHFDWNVKLEMIGGGMVEATDPYKYRAPEASYEPTFVFAQAKDDPQWTQRLTKSYYVHLSNGQYGRILIDLSADSERPDTGISIEAWINPTGSRNLEYDPTKTIEMKY